MQKSIRELSKLFNSSMKDLTTIFPNAKMPINEVGKYINVLDKIINKFSKETIKKNMPENTKAITVFSEQSGKALNNLSKTTTGALKGIGAASAILVLAGVGLSGFLKKLAKQDLGYEKLARQMWTTKENAKEVDMALKTMGVTMQDLWLSPELLNQFNQLRKDSAQLQLPPEYQDGLKIVREVIFELQRLKQIGSLAFQWIGFYILKYAAGPIATIRQGIAKFNDDLIRKVPGIGKIIGTTLGIILRIILVIIQTLGYGIDIVGKLLNFIFKLFDSIPEPAKKVLTIIALIAAAIAAGPIGMILLLIAVLDDLFTALRGGKSVIGGVFNFLTDKAKSTGENVIKGFSNLKSTFKNGMTNIKSDWDSYWNKAKGVLSALEDKAKNTWAKIKEWSKGLWDNAKDKLANIGSSISSKVKDFSVNANVYHSLAPGYIAPNTTNNSNATTNHNTTNNNTNNFNVYSNNPQAAANATVNRLTGINTRNMQGVTN
jgi:ElaB/YqjD/DUF883 family membrane-anchored ribosome-binding protein/Holliday junction resolvasome RuvABC DNA-binding subunit